jgi:multidrug efflux pump
VSSERLDLAHIDDLSLYSRNGVAVPLSQIAHVEYTHGTDLVAPQSRHGNHGARRRR